MNLAFVTTCRSGIYAKFSSILHQSPIPLDDKWCSVVRFFHTWLLLSAAVALSSPILFFDKLSVVRFFHTWLLLSAAVAPSSQIPLDDKWWSVVRFFHTWLLLSAAVAPSTPISFSDKWSVCYKILPYLITA